MPEKKYRFQLLSGLIISTVVLLSLFNIHYLFISRGNFIVFVVTAPLGIFHAYLLATLSKQASSSRYSNYFIGSMLISICAGMMFTGGALENSTAYFLNVPILTAFLLVGRRLGLTYAFIALVFYLAIAIVERSGTAIPQTIPFSLYSTIEIMLWLFFSGTVVLFSITYHHLTQKLMIQQKNEQEKQTYYATHDSLTLLANRHHFDLTLLDVLARSERQHTKIALYLIDLDGFKQINDQFGHDSGDALLKHIALNISQALRSDDMAARVGGDEFAIITQGNIVTDDIKQLSSRLIHAIQTPLHYQGNLLQVSASIGIACYPEHGSTSDALLKQADIAMYSCKKTDNRWATAAIKQD